MLPDRLQYCYAKMGQSGEVVRLRLVVNAHPNGGGAFCQFRQGEMRRQIVLHSKAIKATRPINTTGTSVIMAKLISMISMGHLLYVEANIVPYFLLCKAPKTLGGGKLLTLLTISTAFKKRRDRAVVGKNVLISQPTRRSRCRCHLNGRGRLR